MMRRVLSILVIGVVFATSAHAQIAERTCYGPTQFLAVRAGGDLIVTMTGGHSTGGWTMKIVQDGNNLRFTCRESQSVLYPQVLTTFDESITVSNVLGDPRYVTAINGNPEKERLIAIVDASCKAGLTSEQKATALGKMTQDWFVLLAARSTISADQPKIQLMIDYFHQKLNCL